MTRQQIKFNLNLNCEFKFRKYFSPLWLTSSVIPYIQQIPLSTDFRQHVCYIFFLNRCPIFDESSKLTNTVVHGRSKVPRLISTLGRLLCMKQKLTKLLFIIGFEFCGVLSQLRFVATGQRTPITQRWNFSSTASPFSLLVLVHIFKLLVRASDVTWTHTMVGVVEF